jgi:hypothetical protein
LVRYTLSGFGADDFVIFNNKLELAPGPTVWAYTGDFFHQ